MVLMLPQSIVSGFPEYGKALHAGRKLCHLNEPQCMHGSMGTFQIFLDYKLIPDCIVMAMVTFFLSTFIPIFLKKKKKSIPSAQVQQINQRM